MRLRRDPAERWDGLQRTTSNLGRTRPKVNVPKDLDAIEEGLDRLDWWLRRCEFVSKHAMTLQQYRGANHTVLDGFAIHAFPIYLVVNGDGAIKQRIVMNPRSCS